MNRERFLVELPDGESQRADRFIASLGIFSRSQISQRSVRISLADGNSVKLSRKLKDGDEILLEWDDPPSSEILPEDIPLNILYEDENVVVIDKSQGMVVHPAQGNLHGTLVQGLLFRYRGLEEAFGGDKIRPGIVHRLDKDTSGLIIASKNLMALDFLSEQFRSRSVKKTYLAILKGRLPRSEAEINLSIGRDPRDRKKFLAGVRRGKEATTRYKVLDSNERYSLVSIRILTGRTHQIRVHMLHEGAPVLGDSLYSRVNKDVPDATLMLHAWKLKIVLPHGESRRFEAPIPQRFHDICEEINLKKAWLSSLGEE